MIISMQQMLEAGVHFGHQTRCWSPKMEPYIFGTRHKIHIINLDKTLPLFQEALNFVSSVASKKGKILFVGTKQAAQDVIREQAERCGMPYVSYRWLGGMLTNYKTIRQSIKRLKELEELRNSPAFDRLIKKEGLLLEKEIVKLDRNLGGIKEMNGLPDAVFVIDVGHENIAVSEASKLKIPIVGIVDTNNNPENIDYIIPGNDDSTKAIRLYAISIADAIIEGRGNITEEAAIEAKEVKKTVKKGKQQPSKVWTKKIVHEEEKPVAEEHEEKTEEKKKADAAKKTIKIEKKATIEHKEHEKKKVHIEKKHVTKTSTHAKTTKEKEE
jgi:small subunit ribosomal protein S2